MANASSVGGTVSAPSGLPVMMQATGSSQSITLNPDMTYAIKNNGGTAAAPFVAGTDQLYINFTTTATASAVSGANNLILLAGESVGGVGPGLHTLYFISSGTDTSFTIWPSASRMGNF